MVRTTAIGLETKSPYVHSLIDGFMRRTAADEASIESRGSASYQDVGFSMRVYEALQTGNYLAFFSLWTGAHELWRKRLMEPAVERLRTHVIRCGEKAYYTLPRPFIEKCLGFGAVAHTSDTGLNPNAKAFVPPGCRGHVADTKQVPAADPACTEWLLKQGGLSRACVSDTVVTLRTRKTAAAEAK